MDMLYRAYSCPMDLMRVCINQGRFGAFVEGFLRAESDRRKAETEREQDFMPVSYTHLKRFCTKPPARVRSLFDVSGTER